jgi:hypothetical protein
MPADLLVTLGRARVPDRRELDRSPAGGDPSARICWSLLGRHRVLDRREPDLLPAGGDPPGRIYGRYQAGTRCMIAGTRRDAGPGAVPRLAPAGHRQTGTVCLFAGGAPTRRAGGGPPGRTPPGTVRRALCARSLEERRLGEYVAAAGPGHTLAPDGPAVRGRPAGQSAGRVPGGARCRALSCLGNAAAIRPGQPLAPAGPAE